MHFGALLKVRIRLLILQPQSLEDLRKQSPCQIYRAESSCPTQACSHKQGNVTEYHREKQQQQPAQTKVVTHTEIL